MILTAQLVERGAVRYTPAGLQAVDLVLKHESIVSEDGQPRKVSMEIKSVVIGALVSSVAQLELGSLADFAGFLGSTRNKRGLLFHVTSLVVDSTPPVNPI